MFVKEKQGAPGGKVATSPSSEEKDGEHHIAHDISIEGTCFVLAACDSASSLLRWRSAVCRGRPLHAGMERRAAAVDAGAASFVR